MNNKIKIIFELTKIRITSFVTLTALFGYICYSTELSISLFAAVIGILLLASGSAAINQIQEHKTDVKMKRTMNRPIPSKRISVKQASLAAFILVLLGLSILLTLGFVPVLLGLLNLFWYNFLYTPLKKVSQLAIIPGSLVGAIPPAIGWTSAGGYVFDPQILIISFFFFIWQIPHFWLLLISFGKDYEQANMPSLTKTFDSTQLARITFTWIIATVVTSIMIPLFGVVKNPIIYLMLLLAGIWLTLIASKLLRGNQEKLNIRFAFQGINLFALLVMLIISLDLILI